MWIFNTIEWRNNYYYYYYHHRIRLRTTTRRTRSVSFRHSLRTPRRLFLQSRDKQIDELPQIGPSFRIRAVRCSSDVPDHTCKFDLDRTTSRRERRTSDRSSQTSLDSVAGNIPGSILAITARWNRGRLTAPRVRAAFRSTESPGIHVYTRW